MNCGEVKEWLQTAERPAATAMPTAVAAHVQQCGLCARDAAEIQSQVERLRTAYAQVQPATTGHAVAQSALTHRRGVARRTGVSVVIAAVGIAATVTVVALLRSPHAVVQPSITTSVAA